MATKYDPSMIKSKLGWSNSFNPNAAFPLDFRVYFGSLEAAEAAAATAVDFGSTDSAYHYGMQLYVFDGTTATTYLINGDNTLTEIGAASTAPMLFVADQSAMLALSDIEAGQQVYREDTHTVWIYKGNSPADLNNWAESAAQNDTVWEGTTNKVTFEAIAQSAYDALTTKSENKLYFITDTGRICKGSTDVTKSVTLVNGSFPEASAAIAGRIYLDSASFEVRITMDNVTWLTVTPGYLTDGANWAEADGSKFATIALIKKGIQEAIDAIDFPEVNVDATWDATAGSIKVGDGVAAELTGVNYGAAYDSATRKLTIQAYNGDAVEVTIPDFQDKFVTNGEYHESYEYDGQTYNKVIVLTIDKQDAPVIIPADALVNVYTADNTGKNVIVSISADNVISAELTEEMTQTINAKIDKIANPVGGQLIIANSDGSIAESGAVIASTWSDDGTDVPTMKLVAVAIANAINTASATLEAAIANKMDKLSGTSDDAGRLVVVDATGRSVAIGTVSIADLATTSALNSAVAEINTALGNKVDKVVGTVDDIVVFGANGAIVDSGIKVGGDTIADTPDDKTVATEAAVVAAADDAVAAAMAWTPLA